MIEYSARPQALAIMAAERERLEKKYGRAWLLYYEMVTDQIIKEMIYGEEAEPEGPAP